MILLAEGWDPLHAGAWAVRVARLGEHGPLISALTDTDLPPSLGLGVLAAARAGESWAAHVLGRIYGMGRVEMATGTATQEGDWGSGVPDPDAEAARWRQAAEAAGYGPALLQAAWDQRHDAPARAKELVEAALRDGGSLIPADRARAERLLLQLQRELAETVDEQVAALRGLADRGDGEALAELADRACTGDGVPQDLAAARAGYTAAAKAGEVRGWRELGRLLEDGRGGPVDREGAREACQQAAELGGDLFARRRLAEGFGLTWYAPGPDEV